MKGLSMNDEISVPRIASLQLCLLVGVLFHAVPAHADAGTIKFDRVGDLNDAGKSTLPGLPGVDAARCAFACDGNGAAQGKREPDWIRDRREQETRVEPQPRNWRLKGTSRQ